MLILLLSLSIFFLHYPEETFCSSSSIRKTVRQTQIIDAIVDETKILNCSIDRKRWPFPSILQWYRSTNNYTIPVASQFDDFPVHIDNLYRDRYNLFSNGSLQIVNIDLNDNDTFECRLILIDRGLLDTKESFQIILRVNEPPRFLNRSNSLQIARHYSDVELFCQIYSVPHPTVTWYKLAGKETQTSDEEDLQILSLNSQHLVLRNVDDRSAGKYRCIGENRLGSVQYEFQVLIQGSIYWRQFPDNQTVKINESITLRCEGESSEPLQYEWLKDEYPLSDSIATDTRIQTYSDGLLTINNVQPTDHGAYVCVISITNTTSIRSKPAIITVKYPPIPSQSRPSKNLTFIRGSRGQCPCLLDAYPSIESVSWYRNGVAIRIQPKGGAYTINADYSLIIRSVDSKDTGEYFCRAQNSEGFGRDGLPFHIETKDPIHFHLKPNVTYYVQEQDRLVLPCLALGQPVPTIKWFKNSVEINVLNNNLTLEQIEKNDHGLYVCQASNRYTTTNISTLVTVQNTTPQAPVNIHYEQLGTNLLVSWDVGYDGGRVQHFILWYRMIQKKKQNWKQIRILPDNATQFLLFDLKLRQTFEITLVGENDLGLGTFSSISSIYLSPNHERSIDYLYYSNETDLLRPLSPTDLRLSQSGANLYVTWNHPDQYESSAPIVYYVLQWRSSIFYNNQYSQQSVVVPFPARSYVFKDVKPSKYIIELSSYAEQGTYSFPVESEIQIEFHSIFNFNGSTSLLISILSFLIVSTMALLCLSVFFAVRYYYHRRSYWTDFESAQTVSCCCLPSIHYKPGDCSQISSERHHASLLKSHDLRASPLYLSHRQVMPATLTKLTRSSSSDRSLADSTMKVTTSTRGSDSMASSAETNKLLARRSLSLENSQTFVPSTRTFNGATTAQEDTNSNLSVQTVVVEPEPSLPTHDAEIRRNSVRIPLEAVPELAELSIEHKRSSYTPSVSSGIPLSTQSHPIQSSPLLTTFDSGSLQRRH